MAMEILKFWIFIFVKTTFIRDRQNIFLAQVTLGSVDGMREDVSVRPLLVEKTLKELVVSFTSYVAVN